MVLSMASLCLHGMDDGTAHFSTEHAAVARSRPGCLPHRCYALHCQACIQHVCCVISHHHVVLGTSPSDHPLMVPVNRHVWAGSCSSPACLDKILFLRFQQLLQSVLLVVLAAPHTSDVAVVGVAVVSHMPCRCCVRASGTLCGPSLEPSPSTWATWHRLAATLVPCRAVM